MTFSPEHGILEIKKSEQYKTVEELMAKSYPGSSYYTMLIISSLIIAAGILLNNSAVIIGGMLVAPVLTPILVVGLGLAIGDLKSIRIPLFLLLKSFVVVILSATFLSFLVDISEAPSIFKELDTIQTAFLYFIVATSTGVAATFAWTRREMFNVLPGVAIAVSLVPPLSLVGIGITILDLSLIRFYISVFVFNLIGVVVGSIVIFSLLKFHLSEKKLQKEAQAVEESVREKKEDSKK